MGIPHSRPTYIYGDNMSVIYNTLKPESTLKKKCNAIAHDAVHKSVAMEESLTGNIRSEDNPANLLTKVVMDKRESILHHSCYMTYVIRIPNNW